MSSILPNDLRKYFCEGQIINDETITIDVVNSWHAISNMLVGDCFGIDFLPGSTGLITSVTNPNGNKITITSANHGLAKDDYITIVGTINYDGIYQITNITTNTFDIVCAFIADDTGRWIHGSHGIIPPGRGGNYAYVWNGSFQSEIKDDIFDFALVCNEDTNGKSILFFDTNTDILSISGCGLFQKVKVKDHFMIAVRNTTNSGNLTIKNFKIIIFKV